MTIPLYHPNKSNGQEKRFDSTINNVLNISNKILDSLALQFSEDISNDTKSQYPVCYVTSGINNVRPEVQISIQHVVTRWKKKKISEKNRQK